MSKTNSASCLNIPPSFTNLHPITFYHFYLLDIEIFLKQKGKLKRNVLGEKQLTKEEKGTARKKHGYLG